MSEQDQRRDTPSTSETELAVPDDAVLPIYLVADESRSMMPYMDQLNAGLESLREALLAEPMVASKVRLSIIGFSDDVKVHVGLTDMRESDRMPELLPRGRTRFGAVFRELAQTISKDVRTLNKKGCHVFRPAVFFLTDGIPTDKHWERHLRRLKDSEEFTAAPNIIAWGVGRADAGMILEIATRSELAYVGVAGEDMGAQIANFCASLIRSVVRSGRLIAEGRLELEIPGPTRARIAVDVL
jgi:uncharacterized protein YegL